MTSVFHLLVADGITLLWPYNRRLCAQKAKAGWFMLCGAGVTPECGKLHRLYTSS